MTIEQIEDIFVRDDKNALRNIAYPDCSGQMLPTRREAFAHSLYDSAERAERDT